MINGVLAAAIMHKLKLEQEVWNVSIFHNEALVSSVITVLSQIMSGEKYVRASLSCFGIEERGVPSLSRWRKVTAVKTFLRLGACEESAAQAWWSWDVLDTIVMHTQWPLHHVEGSWGMKLVFGLGVFPKQYGVLSLCPLSYTTCVPGKGKACGKTPVNCRCGVKCLESTEDRQCQP